MLSIIGRPHPCLLSMDTIYWKIQKKTLNLMGPLYIVGTGLESISKIASDTVEVPIKHLVTLVEKTILDYSIQWHIREDLISCQKSRKSLFSKKRLHYCKRAIIFYLEKKLEPTINMLKNIFRNTVPTTNGSNLYQKAPLLVPSRQFYNGEFICVEKLTNRNIKRL